MCFWWRLHNVNRVVDRKRAQMSEISERLESWNLESLVICM